MSLPATAALDSRFNQRIDPERRAILQQSDLFWRLNLALQKSLDINRQMEALYTEFKDQFAIASCDYQLPSENLKLTFGQAVKHHCTFTLVTPGEYMGEITFTRHNRFTNDELIMIENAILGSVYPIRNALSYAQAVKSALTDALTGTGNRIALDSTLRREIDIAHRYQQPFSIAMLDVDYFKAINDQYGHPAGDSVLKQIAQRLMQNCRNADCVFRYGGEEFVVVFNKTDQAGAMVITERLRQAVAAYNCQHKGHMIPVSISAGVSTLKPKDSADAFLERADQSLYQAKLTGRNRTIGEVSEPL